MNSSYGIIAYSNQDIYEEWTVMQRIFDFLEKQRTIKKAQGLATMVDDIQLILDELEEEFNYRYQQLKKSGIIRNSIMDILSCKDQYTKCQQEFALIVSNREVILWNSEETLRKLQTAPEQLLGRTSLGNATIPARE